MTAARSRRNVSYGLVLLFCLQALNAATGMPAQAEAPEAAAMAEAFPTLYAPATTPAEAPTLGEVQADGDVPVLNNPGDTKISLEASEGVTFTDESGTSFGVTSVGEGDPGIAGNRLVTFSRPEGDWAVRPTADGGSEFVEELLPGDTAASYRFDLPEGALLRELENGDVAIVRPATAPVAEVGTAAEQLVEASDDVVEAAAEDVALTSEDESASEALADLAEPIPDSLLEEPEVTVEGPLSDDGSTPDYLAPDATLETLAAAADALEAKLPANPYTEEELDLLASVEGQVEAAETADDFADYAEEVAIEAAGVSEANEMLAEDLVEGVNAEGQAEAGAELVLGDSADEVSRAAMTVIEAQAEVGTSDRVEGVFSAPMTKTVETGAPVPTDLVVTDDQRVDVVIPDTGETVVVDPFFVPVLLFVVRAAVQKAAPYVIRAAVNFAQRTATQTAARVAAERARATAVQRAIQENIRQRAAAAARSQYLARIRAAQQAQARQAQIAREAAQARARAARAQQIARDWANRAREAAVRAAKAAKENVARAKNRAAAAARKAALRVAQVARPVVQQSVKLVQAGTRVLKNARDAVGAAARKAGESLGRHITSATTKAREVSVRVKQIAKNVQARATVAAQERQAEIVAVTGRVFEEAFVEDRDPCDSVKQSILDGFVPTKPGLLFLSFDMNKCLGGEISSDPGFVESVEDYGFSDPPGPTSATSDDLDLVYGGVQDLADQRSLVFDTPSSTSISARFQSWTVPSSFPVGQDRFIQAKAINSGRSLSLTDTFVYVPEGVPYAFDGVLDSARRVGLTDENGDGIWSNGEVATGLIKVRPPLRESTATSFTASFVTGTQVFGTAETLPMTIVGVPAALRISSAARTSSGTVGIGWTAPPAIAASPITRYEVIRDGSSEIRSAGATSTNYTWSGLTNGTTYNFRVRGCNALGCGVWSTSASATPYTVPSTIAKPSIGSYSNALKVSWGTPRNGGASITRYETRGSRSVTTSSTGYTFSMGQDGGSKSFSVRACNAAGCGGWSSSTNSMRAKVISVAKGTVARYGYHYDTKVYGPAGWTLTVTCNDASYRGWAPRVITLDSSGYWRSATLCYSGYGNPHWVNAGSLVSNKVNF